MKKICLLSFLLITGFAFADSPVPYNAYDGEEISARLSAMGGVGATGGRDASVIYTNPAGLFNLGKVFTASFKLRQTPEKYKNQDILSGRSLTFFGFGGSGMGLTGRPLSNFSTLQGGTTVEVKVNEISMGFSNKANKSVAVGMNINYFYGLMGISSGNTKISDANGFGIDWGVIYKANPYINFGLSFLNAPASIKWSGYGSEKPPVIVRSGASVKLSGFLELSADVEKRNYKKANSSGEKSVKIYHIGIEQSILNIVFLRGGLSGEDLNDAKKTAYSAGLGWYRGGAFVDISWIKKYPSPEDSDYIQSFYLSITSPF